MFLNTCASEVDRYVIRKSGDRLCVDVPTHMLSQVCIRGQARSVAFALQPQAAGADEPLQRPVPDRNLGPVVDGELEDDEPTGRQVLIQLLAVFGPGLAD